MLEMPATPTNESICGPKRHESAVDHEYPKSLAHSQQTSSITRNHLHIQLISWGGRPPTWATVDNNHMSHSLNLRAPQVPVRDHFGAKLATFE